MKTLALLTLPLALLLASCGIMARFDTRNDMLRSKAAYHDCLDKNPDHPDACESQRLAFEADVRAYRATAQTVKRF